MEVMLNMLSFVEVCVASALLLLELLLCAASLGMIVVVLSRWEICVLSYAIWSLITLRLIHTRNHA